MLNKLFDDWHKKLMILVRRLAAPELQILANS